VTLSGALVPMNRLSPCDPLHGTEFDGRRVGSEARHPVTVTSPALNGRSSWTSWPSAASRKSHWRQLLSTNPVRHEALTDRADAMRRL
jgi:hypothetical protein